MRKSSTLIAVSMSLVVAGCGGGPSGSTTSKKTSESTAAGDVRTTVNGWLASLETPTKHGNDARACGYLTRVLQRSITQQLRMRGEHGDCRTYAARWTGRSTPPGRDGARVTAIRVMGAKATATLEAPPDRASDVQLQRVAGRWLINNY